MKILVAIDDKESSQAIIDALIKMHWYEGTELHVITVVEKDDVDITPIEDLAVELHNALRHCEVYFLPVKGDPKEAIVDAAAQISADMIVTGSNCMNTLERLLVGSVSQSVLNNAHCPVLVAKAPCCLARDVSPGFRNILVAIDNSVFSDVAVRWLANFSWGQECRFIFAAAVDDDTDHGQVTQSLQERARTLTQLIGPHQMGWEVAIGEPKEAMLKLANKYYADLIVIGSHGRTGLRKLLLGNVAQSISHEAPCAVAVVRGIVEDDASWTDTGAFNKVTPISIEAIVSGSARRPRSWAEEQPHVMPTGM